MTVRRQFGRAVAGSRQVHARAVARLRAVHDATPLLNRATAELARVEVLTRALTLAAQMLISMVPLLIVLGAFLPHGLAVVMVSRVQETIGITGSSARSLRAVLTAPGSQVRTQTGVVGLLVAVVSAMSFVRMLQSTYERVWALPPVRGLTRQTRGLVWLLGWLVYALSVAWSARALGVGGGWSPGRLVVQCVLGLLLWWWTSHTLLLGRVPYADLWTGALLTGVGTAVLTEASHLVMPDYVASNVAQYGPLGVVFALTSWFFAFTTVVVLSAVVGRVVVEDELTWARVREIARRRFRPASAGAGSLGEAEQLHDEGGQGGEHAQGEQDFVQRGEPGQEQPQAHQEADDREHERD